MDGILSWLLILMPMDVAVILAANRENIKKTKILLIIVITI